MLLLNEPDLVVRSVVRRLHDERVLCNTTISDAESALNCTERETKETEHRKAKRRRNIESYLIPAELKLSVRHQLLHPRPWTRTN